MSKTLGSSGTISYAGSALEYVKNASFSIQVDEVEVTDNDSSNGWKEFLMGNRSGTFSFTMNAGANVGASPDAADQKTLVNTLDDATLSTASWIYQPHGTTTDYRKYTFSGYVQEISHDMSNNEVVEITVTVRITGAIVVTAN
jgi:predicted secreted protein